MKYKLDDLDKELIQKAGKQTLSKYEIDNQNYIEVQELIRVIDDLMLEVNHLEEEVQDIKQDMQENYKPAYRDEYEYYGVSRKDFYENI